MMQAPSTFRYSPRQWAPIAKMLGHYRSDAKAALEDIATRYQSLPDKAAEAESFRERRAIASDIADAAASLCNALELHRVDYDIGGESLIEALRGIVEAEYTEADEARLSAPQNREDRRRVWYLNEVIRYLREVLGQRDRGSVDRATGKTVERGAVAFLLAAANPVLPGNYPLTPEAARHALRGYVAPPQPIDWPRVLHEGTRALDDDIPDMAD